MASVRESEKNASKGDNRIDYVDSREDRIVIYATARSSLTAFTYKAKLVNSGTFVVPPVFAESMYDETKNACTSEKQLKVAKAK